MAARTVALGIFCKTPINGLSKTRLSPPLAPEECAQLSACFIRDLARTVDSVCADGSATPYAVYTPAGSEGTLRSLLPRSFELLQQCEKDFGERLLQATADLLSAGHTGAILINADSPTLPASILRDAVTEVSRGDVVVLGPAIDGGYTLIGLSRPHARIFADVPWSTAEVWKRTVERAREIDLPVINLATWYDVDDEETLKLLAAELAGERLPFAAPETVGAPAPATLRFLAERRVPADAGAR